MGSKLKIPSKKVIVYALLLILIIATIAFIVVFLKDKGSAEAKTDDIIQMGENNKNNIEDNNANNDTSNNINNDTNDNISDNTNNNISDNANDNDDADENNNVGNVQNENNYQENNNNNNNNNTETVNNVDNIQTAVIEKTEEIEKKVSEDTLVGWTPINLAIAKSASNVSINKAELDIIKTSETATGDNKVKNGEEITYTIKIQNTGKIDANNIEITDSLPDKTILVEDSITNGGKEENGTIKWILDIKTFSSISVSFKVVVKENESGIVENTAIVNGKETNKVQDTIVKPAQLEIKKNVNKKTAKVGEYLEYNIEVTNKGDINGKAIVKDEIPSQTTLEGNIIVKDSKDRTRNISAEELKKGIDINVLGKGKATIQYKVKINPGEYGKTIKNTAILIFEDDEKKSEVNTVVKEKEITVLEGADTRRSTNFVLAIDVSSSMKGKRIEAAKSAAIKFIEDIYAENDNSTFTVVTFSKRIDTEVLEYTSNGKKISTATKADKDALIGAINGLQSKYGTNIRAALEEIYNVLYTGKNCVSKIYKDNSNVVIFLGDGRPTHVSGDEDDKNYEDGIYEQAQLIKDKNAEIYSIGFGSEAANEEELAYKILKGISSSNTIYTSNTAEELVGNFEEIRKDIFKEKTVKTKLGIATIDIQGEIIIDADHKLVIKNGNDIIAEYTELSKLESGSGSMDENCIYIETNKDGKKQLVWEIKNCGKYPTDANLKIQYYLK